MNIDQDILRQKIVRIVLAGLLLAGMIFIWNWDTSNEVSPIASTQTPSQSTQEPAPAQPEPTPVPEPEPVPTEPFEITLPAGSSGPNKVTEAGKQVYKYTFADGALMNIYIDGPAAAISTDVTWQYSVTDKVVKVAERVDSVCQSGTPGCTAGNGQIEIVAKPAEGSGAKLVIQIVDPNASTKKVADAAAYYETIVNSVRIN